MFISNSLRILVLLLCTGAAIYACAQQRHLANKPHERPGVIGRIDIDAAPRCPESDGVLEARLATRNPSRALLGAGADIIFIYFPGVFVIYDNSSPRSGSKHDLLVIDGPVPKSLDFVGNGTDLMICGRDVPLEIIILRQFCRGLSPEDLANTEIEEIAFLYPREIWIADDLYDQYAKLASLPPDRRLDEISALDKGFRKNPSEWRVRSFSEAMPESKSADQACLQAGPQ